MKNERAYKVKKKPRLRESSKKMPLSAWITQKISQNKRLRPEQRREIEVFMKSQGLSETEEKEKYDEAFKKF